MDDDTAQEASAADRHPMLDPDAPQRVDVERMAPDEPGQPPGGGIHVSYTSFGGSALDMPKPPTVSTWLCLALAWLFLGSKIPFTVFIGLPFNLAALVLAVVCLARGGAFTGLLVLLLGTIGSLSVYLVGVFRFLAVG